MATIKVSKFQGMIPALNDTVLPENNAAYAENAFLYSGAVQGFHEFIDIYSIASTSTRCVFRLPIDYLDAAHLSEARWLEFDQQYTDVIRTSVVGDTYERYYWAAPFNAPRYNTKARILSAYYTASAAGSASGTAYVFAPRSTTRFGVGVSSGRSNAAGYSGVSNSWVLGVPSPTYTPTLTAVSQVVADYTVQSSGTSVARAGVYALSNGAGTNTRAATGTSTAKAETLGYFPAISSVITRSYVVTWVTEYGEEGPPCTAVLASARADASWTLSGLTPPSYSDRNITKLRVYRTITSSQGVATFFQVAELPASTTSYTDVALDTAISANQQLQSTTWSPPPSDLQGWVAMANGIIAGWRGKEVWFSEPYRPHAWPSQYALTTEYDIVGLGVYGQTLIVCTQGFPTAITGINPSSMTMAKVSTLEPCTSRGSIVSAPEGVYYASPNGLILAAQGQFTNVTKNLITKDRWQELLKIATLRAVHSGSGYLAFGGVRPGCFDALSFQNDAFEQDDFTGSYQGLFFDPNNQGATTTMRSTIPVINLMTDPWSGEVMFIRNGKVQWFDTQSTLRDAEPFIWRSKKFQANKQQNFEAVKVYFHIPDGVTAEPTGAVNNTLVQTLGVNQYGLVRFYADGRHIATRELRTSGQMLRLPSGFKTEFWQFEIEARVHITGVQIATSAKELASV